MSRVRRRIGASHSRLHQALAGRGSQPRDSMSRSERAFERLVKAVAHYVEVHGGSVAVAGEVGVIHWPGDSDFNWHLAVKCTGRKPNKREAP